MIISNQTLLSDFVQRYARAAKPLNKWIKDVKEANWTSHSELKQMYPAADYVKNGRYVFNIGGNKYRIVAVVLFVRGVLSIRFVGTHDEYNKIDCSEV